MERDRIDLTIDFLQRVVAMVGQLFSKSRTPRMWAIRKNRGCRCAVSCRRFAIKNLAPHVIKAGFGLENAGTFCSAFHPSLLAA